MNYVQFVSVNRISSDIAVGLARLLDDPFFAVDPKNGSYGLPDVRQTAYDRFCRICIDAGVALPPLEHELIECHLPQKVSEEDKTATQVLVEQITTRVHGQESQEAGICRAIGTMFLSFPNLNLYGSLDRKSLIAMTNRCLIKMGAEPIRPEYKELSNRSRRVPQREVKILIVDDKPEDILKTAMALAGWPKVDVQWLHQKSALKFDPPEEEKNAATAELAQTIIDKNCDIVFMDQGLDKLEGHAVVRKIREQSRSMIFVANTGGTGDELLGAGCVATANKGGRMIEAMEVALDYLS